MRIYSTILLLFISTLICAQITHVHQFPSMQPQHVLDNNLENISFAFSMRVLNSDYDAPLVKLRRASDNTEQDFGWSDNDIVDVSAIDTWRNGSNVYIVTWYDQSELGRNATQTDSNKQPQFYTDTNMPYFKGDGANDYLTVDTTNGIQDLITNGSEGTVLGVMKATTKIQHTFGVLNGTNRWSTHINWVDNNLYFDPGICCNSPRSFNNSSNVNVWQQYTFIKTTTNAVARAGGVQKFNGAHTTGRCTITEDFAIGWAAGNQSGYNSTTSFSEFVMYKTDISTAIILEIEENTITFWNL